ncbi:MAG: energy transducer TonB [Deltaproteobacteria bacterium]|nr:energy transducer TonB [Deltaproteobacteria bacterium]
MPRRQQFVDLDVVEPPPPEAPAPEPETPEPPPEPEAPEPPPPEPERERRRERDRDEPVGVTDPPPDTPPNPDPAPLREEPVDFGGVTLTNDQGAWATQTGSGAAMTGPITTARHVGPRSVRGRDDGMRGGTGTGAAGAGRPPPDLTRRARCTGPPAGSDYPIAAREAGVEGVVELRAQLDERGRVVSTVLRGNDPGWGMRQRCESSVRSRWRCDPALDAQGRAVPTTVTLRCRYELND